MLELALRHSLADIMLQAHAGARAIGPRLPYAARLSLTLRRAWREARAAALCSLRAAVEARVERLLAFLDHLDGDADLEPWLAGSQTSEALDAEDESEDLEEGGDTEPNGDELDGPDDNGMADQGGMAEIVAWHGGTRVSRSERLSRTHRVDNAGGHFNRYDDTDPAGGRAALVLSAVGADWRREV